VMPDSPFTACIGCAMAGRRRRGATFNPTRQALDAYLPLFIKGRHPGGQRFSDPDSGDSTGSGPTPGTQWLDRMPTSCALTGEWRRGVASQRSLLSASVPDRRLSVLTAATAAELPSRFVVERNQLRERDCLS
jgi:hypothetical protein